jgi:hypothetical protein
MTRSSVMEEDTCSLNFSAKRKKCYTDCYFSCNINSSQDSEQVSLKCGFSMLLLCQATFLVWRLSHLSKVVRCELWDWRTYILVSRAVASFVVASLKMRIEGNLIPHFQIINIFWKY